MSDPYLRGYSETRKIYRNNDVWIAAPADIGLKNEFSLIGLVEVNTCGGTESKKKKKTGRQRVTRRTKVRLMERIGDECRSSKVSGPRAAWTRRVLAAKLIHDGRFHRARIFSFLGGS